MLAYPIAAATLLLVGQASAAAAPKKHDFMRAMDKHTNKRRTKQRRKLAHKEFRAEIQGVSEISAELRKKVIEKSTFVKPEHGQRKLQNYNYNNGNSNNGNDYNNADEWQQDAQANYNYQNNYANNGETKYKYYGDKDGSDDYFMAFGDWENQFGFDPTQFSLSYHRCAAVRQFDDEIAAQEDTDSVFATKRFVVFRFCPEATCMGWQEEDGDVECDEENYGEEYCEYLAEYAEYMKTKENYEAQYQNQAYQNGQGEVKCGEGEDCEQSNAWGQYEEEEKYYGARGEGCQNNYGEYMMEMEDYLELMLEYQEERYETYCEYCEDCMYKVYQQWLKNGGNRELTYEEFKDSKEHDQLRKLSEDRRELGGYYGQCPEYDTCSEYAKMCNGGGNDGYSEYFECQQVERNNGQVAYVGPHCAEDGYTITLGVYGDEKCNEYIGNGVNIANYIGEEIDIEEDILKTYYNSAHGPILSQLKYTNEENVCIPCRKGDLMWEKRGNSDDDGNINYDDVEVNEICGNLYEVSARCDKHYRSYNKKSKQAKYAEAVAQEDLTCDFIDSVVMGNFNELGYVNLGKEYTVEGQPGWMANNIYAQQYGHYITEVTPLQIFGLILSILAVCILGIWSMTLNRSLSKSGPWRPRRGFRAAASPSQADLTRQNSGIVMGRSQSNASYYMS